MPALLNFFNSNGTMLTNSHTPLIAHTADDLLTTATGLYGDRHGAPIANSYRSYNTDGTFRPNVGVRVLERPHPGHQQPEPGHDTNPNLVYSPVPPATSSTPITPNKITPAPWVPFTKAGCNVGDIATDDEVLAEHEP